MTGQIGIISAAYKNSLIGKFVRVSYSEKIRLGQVISCGSGPMGNNITVDTQDGPRTLPLENMENSCKFITEMEFRHMFPNWEPYQPK